MDPHHTTIELEPLVLDRAKDAAFLDEMDAYVMQQQQQQQPKSKQKRLPRGTLSPEARKERRRLQRRARRHTVDGRSKEQARRQSKTNSREALRLHWLGLELVHRTEIVECLLDPRYAHARNFIIQRLIESDDAISDMKDFWPVDKREELNSVPSWDKLVECDVDLIEFIS